MDKKLVTEEQLCWNEMYVYQTDVVKDLLGAVAEFIGESEHQGIVARAKEVSNDTVDDMKAWRIHRKSLLLKDFMMYFL